MKGLILPTATVYLMPLLLLFSIFLLARGQCSAWHRVLSDEVWHLLEGAGLRLWLERSAAVLRHWRPSLAVGAAGFLASAAWFIALTLENAAYVRAVASHKHVAITMASELAGEDPFAGIAPVTEIDGRTIGTGERGPMVARLQQWYVELLDRECE